MKKPIAPETDQLSSLRAISYHYSADGERPLTDRQRQPVKPEMRHFARRQIYSDRFLHLEPVHIIRLQCFAMSSHNLLLLRCQYRHTGIPAARIAKPIALLIGLLITVASTINAQASTNSPVVTGWPGALNPAPAGSRLRRDAAPQVDR